MAVWQPEILRCHCFRKTVGWKGMIADYIALWQYPPCGSTSLHLRSHFADAALAQKKVDIVVIPKVRLVLYW